MYFLGQIKDDNDEQTDPVADPEQQEGKLNHSNLLNIMFTDVLLNSNNNMSTDVHINLISLAIPIVNIN